jgi:hypothetical protein
MYLWHWPTYLVLTQPRTHLSGLSLLAVRLVAVVTLSWVTHTLVDEPIRRGVRLRSPRLARSAVVMVVIAVAVGTFAATVGAEPALSGDVGQLVDRGGPPRVEVHRHLALTPASPAAPSAPTTTVPPPPIKLLVVGDSQAATLAQGLNADGGHHGLSMQPGVVVWNRSILGCSIISQPTVVVDGEQLHNKCGGNGFWQRQWPDDVRAFHPDAVVVMAGAWDVFDVDAGGTTIGPGDPAWTAGYEQDVGLLFDVLHSTGAPVVAIEPPCFGHDELPGTAPESPERFDPARVAAVHRVWVDEAAAHGATLENLNSLLCPGGTSDPSIRPDGAHFATAGADRTAPIVVAAVRDAIATASAESVLGPYAP